MKKEYDFSIISEDYVNSTRRYDDIFGCPFYQAVQRQFPDLKFTSVGPSTVCNRQFSIASLQTSFSTIHFNELRLEGKEFHTKITFH